MPRKALRKVTSTMLLGVLGLAVLASPVLAQPGGPEAAEMHAKRAKAESLERDGDHDACGQAYLEIYEGAPQADGMDEILYNAGVCFEAGGSIGFAIRMYATLEKQFPRSRLARNALMRMSAAFASVVNYEQAARGYEQYAKRYAGEKDAPAALSQAVTYRQALGHSKEAIANLEFFIRQYGRKLKRETAEAVFRLAEIHELGGDRDRAAEAYQRYLREVGKVGGADRLLIAHAKLGAILWKQSCPSEDPRGACIRLERDSMPAQNKKLPTRCGPHGLPRSIVLSRTRRLTEEAERHLKSALLLGQQNAKNKASDPPRHADVAYWLGAARFHLLDERLEQFLALRYPEKADLEGDAGSRKRFQEWMSSTERQLTALLGSYEQVGAINDESATWALAASARMGLALEHFSYLLRSAEVPARLRRSSGRDIDAYCESLQDKARPLADRWAGAAGHPAAAEVHGASHAVADILATAPLQVGQR